MQTYTPVGNLVYALLQLLFGGVRVQGELQPRTGAELEQTDSHLNKARFTRTWVDVTRRAD